ncbi:MAG: diphthamide biosynthesis enzyme Dph2 [Candidatus Micrarchaeota archaeon]|nr:diphthamide biosynthesis enzyme Dph2 [Candidatus Micrarchaeota archaeon]
MRILLQFPEGLKKIAKIEAEKLEKEGHEVFISASPCWGGCDLALDEAKKIKAKKIIHYGHCKFHEVKGIEVEYKLYPIDVDLNLIKKEIKKIKNFKKIGLITNVSHIHQFSDFKKIFIQEGFEVFSSKGKLTQFEGQVLGCDSLAADNIANKVDLIVYIGGGNFHPLGLSSSKKIFVINPFVKQSYFLDEELLKKQKREKGMLLAALQAKNIGIIVSTKSGQFNLKAAMLAKKRLEKFNKKVFILITNEVNFEALKDFNFFDVFITTACPRLEDDYLRVEKPILNISKLPSLLLLLKQIEN